MKGLVVTREADAANDVARTLHAQGVNAIVVLIHEGGWQQTESGQDDANACADFSGPIIDIAKEMSPDVDVIISGHTHRAYVCTIASKLVTSAASFSRLVTDIDLHLDRASGRVTSKSARNIVVTRDVGRDGRETAVLDHYRPFAAVVAGKPVGTAASTIPNMRNIAGESALGDLIADGMLDGARGVAGGAQVALQNIGGIRSDLVRSEPSGTITYNDVFNVLPFGNVVIVKTLTGDALVRMLEQQTLTRVLQVSGITYAWDPTRPAGSRIERASIRIDGKPMVPTERYRVASNDFVWNGGDDFTVATEGTDPIAVGTDVDVFVTFLGTHSPVRPGPQDRIRLYH